MQQSSHSLRPTFPLDLFHLGHLAPPTINARSKVTCVVLLTNYLRNQLIYAEDGKLLKFHHGLEFQIQIVKQ